MKREIRRIDRKLPVEEAWKILEESEVGYLATVNEDGSPYCVPMAGALVGQTVYFHCAIAGQKLDNLAADPRACYTCVNYSKNQPEKFTMLFTSCVAEGKVRVVTDEAERLSAVRAIAAKYSAEHLDTPHYERNMKSMPVVTVLALEVEHLCGKSNPGPRRG